MSSTTAVPPSSSFHTPSTSVNQQSTATDPLKKERLEKEDQWLHIVSDLRHYSVDVDDNTDMRWSLSRHVGLISILLITLFMGLEMLIFHTERFRTVSVHISEETLGEYYFLENRKFPDPERRTGARSDPFLGFNKWPTLASIFAYAPFYESNRSQLINDRAHGFKCHPEYISNWTQIPKKISLFNGIDDQHPYKTDRRTFIERTISAPINWQIHTKTMNCAPSVLVYAYDHLYPLYHRDQVQSLWQQINRTNPKEVRGFKGATFKGDIGHFAALNKNPQNVWMDGVRNEVIRASLDNLININYEITQNGVENIGGT